MSESPAPERPLRVKEAVAPPAVSSRRRRWGRRLLIAFLAVPFVALVVLLVARAYFRHTGQRALDAETTRLDAEDPGWRLDDLMAAREKAAPPPAKNSAVVVRNVRSLMPTEWQEWAKVQSSSTNAGPPPLNRLQLLEDLTHDGDLAGATREARDLGLTLRNYPQGYHVNTVGDLPFLESLEETQGAREVAHLMKIDAILATQAGDPVRGLRAAHAVLNAGRSVGDEPMLISSLVRIACSFVAAETTMRVLALTDSKAALTELGTLQAALYAELEEPVLLNGLRGERAVANHFFEGVNSGRIPSDAIARLGEAKPSQEHRIVLYFLKAFMPEDQRRYLRVMSDFIDAGAAPPQERAGRTQQIEADVRTNRDIRYRWHGLVLPAASKVIEASVRQRAELLSAAALIACERFRLTRDRWPTSLAELPKDLLPAIPTDPYTGEPMKFAKLPDGIAVYAAAPKISSGIERKRLTNPLGGTEVGWRLYDPAHRGLPPLPNEKPDVPDPDGRP